MPAPAWLCSNCGQRLSATNVQLALEDIGEGADPDRITLYCPGYDDRTGCPAYEHEETAKMAYWTTQG